MGVVGVVASTGHRTPHKSGIRPVSPARAPPPPPLAMAASSSGCPAPAAGTSLSSSGWPEEGPEAGPRRGEAPCIAAAA